MPGRRELRPTPGSRCSPADPGLQPDFWPGVVFDNESEEAIILEGGRRRYSGISDKAGLLNSDSTSGNSIRPRSTLIVYLFLRNP
jgi:hypothetical protein